ncbi:MAG: peptidase M22 [Clostridia bacterium]|nr:peptidase M22 [Clostridia bacterium]
MSVFLGVDTSNYTTSVALFNSDTNSVISKKKLLPVEQGEVGLMQSKALFNHIRQLPEVMEAAFSSFLAEEKISAVAVSSRPRGVEGSYMPVFLAGMASAHSVASALRVPCYYTSHQAGHVIAALHSAGRMDLINKPFIAFHVSGGTTEALLVTPDDENIIKCEIVAKSLDLKAGQAIDRVAVMLGLPFPGGAMLDKLSQSGEITEKIRPTLKGADCCLSGLENKCKNKMDSGEEPENVARYAIEYIYETIKAMSDKIREQYGDLEFLYAGGVMSNSIISSRIKGIFAAPEFSSDNAAGVAILASMLHNKKEN